MHKTMACLWALPCKKLTKWRREDDDYDGDRHQRTFHNVYNIPAKSRKLKARLEIHWKPALSSDIVSVGINIIIANWEAPHSWGYNSSTMLAGARCLVVGMPIEWVLRWLTWLGDMTFIGRNSSATESADSSSYCWYVSGWKLCNLYSVPLYLFSTQFLV